MSKKYKGKLCVYCAENESTTADHVISREFFLSNRRDQLPKVPACETCNREKARLEHYLTTVLPFGGKHPDAVTNLETMVPKRLDKNKRLRRELESGVKNIWATRYPSLIVQSVTTVPFDPVRLERLFALTAKGLAWHHWQVLLSPGYSATSAIFSDRGAEFLNQIFTWKARNRVIAELGENTFSYEGLQAEGEERLTAWRFNLYGGVTFGGDPRLPSQTASLIVAVTGPDSLIHRLERTIFDRSHRLSSPKVRAPSP